MNTPFASLINTMLPALALVASVEVFFRLWKGVNAATRFAVWWLVLAAVLIMPLAYTPEHRAAEPVVVAHAPTRAVAATEPAAAAEAAPVRTSDLPSVLPALGCVTAAMMAHLLWSFVWLRRTKHRAAVSAKSHRLDYLLLRYGVVRRVRLLETNAVRSPIAAGFRKPAVVLPPDLTPRLSAEELDLVLLHEVAHLARRDDWTNLLAQVVRAALWFHPAVRYIIHRMEQEREMACDEWAAQAAGERRRYAASLTRLVELRLEASTTALATGALGGKPRITRRVESLLRNAGAKAAGVSFPKVIASLGAVVLLAILCSQSPELVAADEEPLPVSEPSQGSAAPGERAGYLAGLTSAGYAGLSVDDLIELKNSGVSPEFASAMSSAGLGKVPPKQLIELRNHGVKPGFVRGLANSGFRGLTLRNLLELASQGVKPEEVTEVHSLGFGPYSPEQFIEFTQRGVGASYFRQLKNHAITGLEPKDIIEAVSQGIGGKDIHEARRYHPNINMQQIVKLKQAGVI